jgi:glycosyltransferase involved in cell wall biosynthesis
MQDVQTNLYLKCPIENSINVDNLFSLSGVTIHSPLLSNQSRELSPQNALNNIAEDDILEGYDAIFLRGRILCIEAAKINIFKGRIWGYFTDIPLKKSSDDDNYLKELELVIENSQYIFVQTPQLGSHLKQLFSNIERKIRALPPMVPNPSNFVSRKDIGTKKDFIVVYSGQFKREYASLEMLRIFRKAKENFPSLKFNVFGNKIHASRHDQIFRKSILKGLESTPELIWHKSVSREDVLSALSYADIGWAWRLDQLEQNTLEISTKLLEYSSNGIPPIMARSKINQEVFGVDYPLFANSEAEAYEKLIFALNNPEIIKKLQDFVRKISAPYQFSNIRKNCLDPLLAQENPKNKKIITIVGHDHKFIDLFDKVFADKYEVSKNYWWGHRLHDVHASEEVARTSDIIFCEWFLGNAVWHSKNKLEGKTLVVRFHRQELETEYPRMADMKAIDLVIVVSEHTKRDAIEKFNWEEFSHKIIVIPNGIEADYLTRTKIQGAEFNIGMVGFVPRMKRLDLAIDFLEKCLILDQRFKLVISGRMPQEYPWMLERKDEMDYYAQQMQRIDSSPILRESIKFCGWSDNMAEWYRNIGYVLSVSDYEGTHQAVAEGGISGAIPLMLDWPGADEVYQNKWVHSSLNEIVNSVNSQIKNKCYQDSVNDAIRYMRENFDSRLIGRKLIKSFEF